MAEIVQPQRANAVLTFGVELEFMYLWQVQAEEDHPTRRTPLSMEKVKALESVHEALVQARRIPISRLDAEPVGDYSKWSVTDDVTIDLEDLEHVMFPKSCNMHGVEVISRILRYREDSWSREIKMAVRAINSLDRPNDCKRVIANLSCGFHVHVGQGQAGFVLEEMRRVLMMVTAFERHLDQLHGASRIHRDCYSDPVSLFFINRYRHANPPVPRTVHAWLLRIAELSVHDFPGKEYTYNFDSCTYVSPGLRTIEFRQHRGTLIPDEIQAWISVVTNLVRFAVQSRDDELLNFCLTTTSDPNFTIRNLLVVIDVPTETLKFYASRLDGDVSWLRKHDVPHRPDANLAELNGFMNMISTVNTTNVDIKQVKGTVTDKLMRHGYGFMEHNLMNRIREQLMTMGDRQDVSMSDAIY